MLHFGTNGIRGKIDELTPESVVDIGRAIGYWAKNQHSNSRVNSNSNGDSDATGKGLALVATDYRLTRDVYKHAIIAGLTSAGMDVMDANVLPSPVVDYLMRNRKYSCGIIITASHNPPEWNGIKVVDANGVSVSREVGAEIEKNLGSPPVSYEEIGKVSDNRGLLSEYLHEIQKFVDLDKIRKNKNLKVVMDPGNGTLCDVLFAYKRIVNIIPINAHPDGNFPGRKSEPTEENIQTLIRTVKDTHADLGIAWDGDGDRIVLVDEKGNYVLGDKVFALSVLGFGKGRKGPILTTVSTSRIIEDVGNGIGLKTIYTKVGAPYLSEKGLELKENFAFGGEEVGGIIWPEVSLGKDGIFTAFKMLELVSQKPMSEWLSTIPKYYNKKVKIECEADKKTEVMNKVQKELENELETELSSEERDKIITIDGVRINFDDGWVILRPSGTENIIRVFAEAKTIERVEYLSRKYVDLVKNIIATL